MLRFTATLIHLLILTLTWSGSDAIRKDIRDVHKGDMENNNGGDIINREDRGTDISIDIGDSDSDDKYKGHCIGDCCQCDEDCKGENVECDWDRKICSCKEGFILNQDGNCVHCSTANFHHYTHMCPRFCEICEQCELDCTDKKYDIIIIVDSSGSIGFTRYNQQRPYISYFTSQFAVSATETRFGFITYSTNIITAFNLNAPGFDTNVDVIDVIINNPYIPGMTRTDLALQLAEKFLLSPANRPGIPNEVILITDGYSYPSHPAILLLANTIKSIVSTRISVIGVGSFISPDLEELASSPDDYYEAPDKLTPLIEEMLDKLCG